LNGTAPYSYQWSNGTNTAVNNSLQAGSYSLTVTDVDGCTSEASITLNAPQAINIFAQSQSPDCFGDSNGSITLSSITGGSGNYEYSLDGQLFQPVPAFPLDLSPLPPGDYELTIQDINDCMATQSLIISPAIQNTIDLGEDIEITLGDIVQFDPVLNFEAAEIIWDQVELSCQACLDPIVRPFETTTYTLIAADSLGCDANDEITVKVRKSRSVFIPSAFSPNGDGSNDYFYPFAGSNVIGVKQLKIFSRWGEVLYSIDNIQANDYSVGWNGDFKGERMSPGVYVYLMEVVFVDGQTRLFKGDVTLMK